MLLATLRGSKKPDGPWDIDQLYSKNRPLEVELDWLNNSRTSACERAPGVDRARGVVGVGGRPAVCIDGYGSFLGICAAPSTATGAW